jgi:16S rRNA (cytidine1402-2'-O)-methyltransferase
MLYLLPNLLSETENPRTFLPPQVAEVIATLDGVICETEKKARWYLKQFTLRMPLQQFPLVALNEHTTDISEHLAPLLRGENWGILSDAGASCIADPGAQLVQRAWQQNIPVKALFGPCSITLALQLSGMGGQRFCFHGYLPRDKAERLDALRALEKRAAVNKETQIWIEAPYRNRELLASCLEGLQASTLFCVACDLDSPNEKVWVQKIGAWKAQAPVDLDKKPAIFLLSAS